MGRRIEFSQTIIEGFASVQKPLKFELDRGGVNLIVGENGNGKTTVFSALMWCLYGVNLKGTTNAKVATWEHVRLPGFRGTRVVTEFFIEENSYMVARHLNFKGTTQGLQGKSELMLFVNGDLLAEEQHKGDIKAYIIRLLGMDSKTFLNSVLFGQRMKRLIESENDDKRKMFEKLFDLEFIGKAKTKAETLAVSLDKEANALSTQNYQLGLNIEGFEARLGDFEESLANFEEDRKVRIDGLKAKIKELRGRVATNEESKKLRKAVGTTDEATVAAAKEKIAKLDKQYAEAVDELAGLSRNVGEFRAELRKQERDKQRIEGELEDLTDTCPTCKQELPKKEIATARKSLTQQIAKIVETSKILTKKLTEAEELEQQGKELKETINVARQDAQVAFEQQLKLSKAAQEEAFAIVRLDDDIQRCQEMIEEHQQSIKELEDKQPPKMKQDYPALIADAKAAKAEVEKNYYEKDAEFKRVEWWNKKGFGASGMKAYVFNAMLEQLNGFVEKYAERLGIMVKFSVDLSKASTPFYTKCYKLPHTQEVDYEELSGGEKQRVDVCLVFAMYDLVSRLTDVNLLILDEVFEGLDKAGIEHAFDLIRLKSDKKTIYVVTHSDTIDSLNTKSIVIGKHPVGESTYIVE